MPAIAAAFYADERSPEFDGDDVDPGFILVAIPDPRYEGFFSSDGLRAELIGGLVYILLPMVAAGLVCRLGMYLWTWRTGRQPRLAASPTSAIIGVLSYYLIAAAVLSQGDLQDILKRIPYVFLAALVLTCPCSWLRVLFFAFTSVVMGNFQTQPSM